MALIFQRLARNFVKNGYYPTDGDTIQRVLNTLQPADNGEIRIIDPCAGEGTALAECKAHLGTDQTEAFGIEYEEERAYHSKEILNRCIHGDFQDTIIGKRSFGLLWLNPPYGDLVADKAQTAGATEMSGRKRLEKLFYLQANGLVQFGGVMVLLVPFDVLDREFRKWITTHFERVEVFKAPEQKFRQVVIMGVKTRAGANRKAKQDMIKLQQASAGQAPEFPETWGRKPYIIPASTGEVKFEYIKIDAKQLGQEIDKYPCLWEQFNLHLKQGARTQRRPLRQLSDWHLALSLAAGQIAGVVHSKDGKVYVVKGATHKEKETKTKTEVLNDEGKTRAIRTLTDKFVPVIKALDFTPGSPTFGQALTIK